MINRKQHDNRDDPNKVQQKTTDRWKESKVRVYEFVS